MSVPVTESAPRPIKAMLIILALVVIASIAVPRWIRARRAGSEVSITSSLRTLIEVNRQYRSRSGRYAGNLVDLEEAGSIDAVLAAGTKAGYALTYRGGVSAWSCAADPERPGESAERYFFVDESGVIRFRKDRTAGSADPPID